MTVEARLESDGFKNVRSDEPHEDYWILEMQGLGVDMLVEKEGEGWTLSRSPEQGDPQGEWKQVSRGLSDEDLLDRIDSIMRSGQ